MLNHVTPGQPLTYITANLGKSVTKPKLGSFRLPPPVCLPATSCWRICQFILPTPGQCPTLCVSHISWRARCIFQLLFNLCSSEDDSVRVGKNERCFRRARMPQSSPSALWSVCKSASSWAGINFINQQGVLSIDVAIQLMTENGFGFFLKKILLLIFTAHGDISFYCLCFYLSCFWNVEGGERALSYTLWVN